MELNDNEKSCLTSLYHHSSSEGEFCIAFSMFELSYKDTRKAVRSLADKGFAEFYRGLMTEEGEVAGSGYCITPDGIEFAEKNKIDEL